jgi:hypothetical protein
MSGQEVLNQDEIDALLNGVDAGAVNTEAPPAPGETRAYDFSREMRIVRGRMPTLEMVNERFARQTRVSLYNLLRKTVELAVGQVTMKKFSEYTHSLALPINLNLVRSTRCAAPRCSCSIRSWCSRSSTISSAAWAVTPRSRDASSRPPRCAWSTCSCAAPSPT